MVFTVDLALNNKDLSVTDPCMLKAECFLALPDKAQHSVVLLTDLITTFFFFFNVLFSLDVGCASSTTHSIRNLLGCCDQCGEKKCIPTVLQRKAKVRLSSV